ncbi:MAG: hypothetical protein R3F39_20420 [Myxococcota bacterium]
MSLLVSDANIFLDFEAGAMLAELFASGHDIGTPDLWPALLTRPSSESKEM